MKLIAMVALAIPLLAVDAERTPLRSVTAVRHWTVGDVIRVAVVISGEFEFRTDRLHDPERVYFDILNSRPRFEGKRLFSENIDEKLLKRVRVAETVPGVTRVVLDLGDNVESATSELVNPNRLIIELRAAPAPPGVPTSTTAAPPPSTPAPSIPPLPKPPAIAKADVPRNDPATSVRSVLPPPAPPNVPEPSKSQVSAPALSVASEVVPVAKMDSAKPVDSSAPVPAPVSELAKSARHTSSGENSLVRALGLKINRIVIDPGHGGHDEGTSGPKGLLEKDLVLDVSKRLGKLIQEHMGAEVIYTRTDDTFVPLEGRTAIANDKKADLFLSIHANSSPVSEVAGIETYYLNFTESKEALDIASRENASSQRSVFELRDILQKISQRDKAEESKEFAGRLQAALYAFSARYNSAEKNRGVRKAPFVVLVGANMPSVLAEIGFLSNPREESLLRKPEYRQKLAEALYRGVSRYAESLSHFQVAAGPVADSRP